MKRETISYVLDLYAYASFALMAVILTRIASGGDAGSAVAIIILLSVIVCIGHAAARGIERLINLRKTPTA